MGAWADDLLGNDHVQDELISFQEERINGKAPKFLAKLEKLASRRNSESYDIESFVGVIYYIVTNTADLKVQKFATKPLIKSAIIGLERLSTDDALSSWVNPKSRRKHLDEAKKIFTKRVNAKKKNA